MTSRAAVAMVGLLAFALTAGTARADYYDTFDDGDYTGDPNVWDVDDQTWTIYVPIGGPNAHGIDDGWLRLWTAPDFLPYSFILAYVDDDGPDPNLSETIFDDTQPHYILSRVKVNDPNGSDKKGGYGHGTISLLMQGNPFTWDAYIFEYEAYGNDFILTSLAGLDFSFGHRRRMGDPNDPNDPNAVDELNGFWMCFQFDPTGADGLGDPNDPNNHWIRGAAWDGGQFDWDGTWWVNVRLVERWDPNGIYGYLTRRSGLKGLVASGSADTGLRPDESFDNVEVRWGTFTNVSHSLDLTIVNENYGTITIDPDLLDDLEGDPNDPNQLRRYTDGTEVVLVAEPVEGKSWNRWTVFDPNYPGDANYATSDTNAVLLLTMNQDHIVEAAFKCGSSLPPFVAMTLLAMGVAVVARRVWS